MIHPFVSEHLADAVREHGLDLPGLTWLPYHAWDLGPCVAAEVGPGVRLVLRRPDGTVFVGESDGFRIEDRTPGGDVLTRSFGSVESVVRLLREWAAESTAKRDAALAAYDLAVAHDDGIRGALASLAGLAEPASVDAVTQRAESLDAQARRLRRMVADEAARGLGPSEDGKKRDAWHLAEAHRLTREAAQIRATAPRGEP